MSEWIKIEDRPIPKNTLVVVTDGVAFSVVKLVRCCFFLKTKFVRYVVDGDWDNFNNPYKINKFETITHWKLFDRRSYLQRPYFTSNVYMEDGQ